MRNNIVSLLKSDKFGEIVRFMIVGVLATATHYLIYYLLVLLGVNVNLSFTIGYLLSWIGNFWLTAHFTFKKNTSAKKGIGFAASHIVNYLLQLSCLNTFVWLGVPAMLAPVPVYCICIPVNFLLVRFVFSHF